MKNWLSLLLVLLIASCAKLGTKNILSGVPLVNGLASTKLKQNLTQEDIKIAVIAEHNALKFTPTDGTQTWQNPKTGNSGQINVGQPYQIGSQDCRRYEHVIRVKGVEKRANGTACKNAQGIWAGLE